MKPTLRILQERTLPDRTRLDWKRRRETRCIDIGKKPSFCDGRASRRSGRPAPASVANQRACTALFVSGLVTRSVRPVSLARDGGFGRDSCGCPGPAAPWRQLVNEMQTSPLSEIAVFLLGLAATGCSFLSVSSPPSDPVERNEVTADECTASVAAPALDVTGVVVSALNIGL